MEDASESEAESADERTEEGGKRDRRAKSRDGLRKGNPREDRRRNEQRKMEDEVRRFGNSTSAKREKTAGKC